jgi:hypothetical protein
MSSNNAAHQLKITYPNKECSKIDADTIDVGELFEVRKFRKLASPFLRALIDLAHDHHPISSANVTRPLKITCHIKKCSKIDADAVGVSDLFEIRKFRRLPSQFPEALIALAHCHHPMSSVNAKHQLKVTYPNKQCSKIDADTIDVVELFEVREFRRLPSLFHEALITLAHCHHPVRSVNATHHLKITYHSQQCSKIDADIMDVGELFGISKFRKLASPLPRALIALAHSHHPMSSSNATHHLKITCHIKQCSKFDADTVGVSGLFEVRKFRRLPSHFPEALIALAHSHHPMSSNNAAHQLKITYPNKECSKIDADTIDVT